MADRTGRAIDVVLFDLGGVLTPDWWETLILSPEAGLADVLELDRTAAEAAGKALWPSFDRRLATEAEYWEAFGGRVGRNIPKEAVEAAEGACLRANPNAAAVLAGLSEAGLRIGTISNNTAFWAPKQFALLGFAKSFDPGLVFLSHEAGAVKGKGNPDLFALAAGRTDPGRTLVIDDRTDNLTFAAKLGFQILHHPAPGLRPPRGEGALAWAAEFPGIETGLRTAPPREGARGGRNA